MADKQNIVELVKNLLFPKFCAGCKKEGDWVCENCLQEIVSRPQPNLLLIGEGGGEPSPVRRGQGEVSFLDGVTALFNYGENTISKLIQMFKYNYLLEIADIFEKIIDGFVIPAASGRLRRPGNSAGHWIPNQVGNDRWEDFVIIPVPLHARRERERGFNQAEILAELFAKKFGLSINTNLSRAIYTAQQVKLSGEQRRANLKDAFVFNGIAPEKVLLVDDVFTTGTTMQECAKTLKNSGVKIVWGLVLARG
jgi:ComF family protein